ncbi:MAG: cation transporter [Pseudomonadota bacterium]
MIAGTQTSETLATWHHRAWLLAWATILYNVLEGLVAMGFGVAEESVALFGFGVDSFIEVASALLVLWRLRAEDGEGEALSLARERRATQAIGTLLVVLAAGTVVAAALQLGARSHPTTTLPGMVIALVSLSFMFALWWAKRQAARILDSSTLAQDAACSLACIQLSSVLLLGSLLFALSPALWWADAVAALALALLIAREGVGAVRAARREDFSGGCGCAPAQLGATRQAVTAGCGCGPGDSCQGATQDDATAGKSEGNEACCGGATCDCHHER